jgi:hypothetical protein
MLICAQWLHCTWIAFKALPVEEQMRWHLFAEMYYRKESLAAKEARARASGKKAQQQRGGR